MCRNRIIIALLSGSLLAGCQSSALPPAPQPETQVSQLSSLIAASSWLRDYCNRQDIASDNVLTHSALKQAQQRGWDTKQVAWQQLNSQVAERYQALTTDSVNVDEKCSTLNRAVANFLRQTQVSQ